jgi:hypothetical protein
MSRRRGALSSSGRLAGVTAQARMAWISQIVADVFLGSHRIASIGFCGRAASRRLDRDASIDRDALSNARTPASFGLLEVLIPDRRDGFEVRPQRGILMPSSRCFSTQRSNDARPVARRSWIAVAFWRGSLQSMSSPALMLEQRSSGMPALRQISLAPAR